MRPLFLKNFSSRFLNLRFIIIIIASTSMMLAESRGHLKTARFHLSALIYPIQYMVDMPVKTSQWLSSTFNTKLQLLAENAELQEQNLRLQAILQKFEDLNSENARLRLLLQSVPKASTHIQLAEVLAVAVEPYSRKIVINKGQSDGVFEGQAVVDAHGVMGQVIQVDPFSSTVMLLTDSKHELPVQVVRTGLQTVAVGRGLVNRLDLLYLSTPEIKTEIKAGDLLVTSGNGGHFPAGYPVGTVAEVNLDISQPYAQIQAVPKALLERNREVLLIWENTPVKPSEPSPSVSQEPSLPIKIH